MTAATLTLLLMPAVPSEFWGGDVAYLYQQDPKGHWSAYELPDIDNPEEAEQASDSGGDSTN